jgi:signal transduction histidine kinase
MVSHELRTPINVVLGWTHMLTTGTLDAAGTAKALEIIERNAHAQAHVIDDLLDVSRFASGQTRFQMQSINLGSVVRAAVDGMQPDASARGIHIAVRADDEHHVVLGDPQRLQQVVWNLLSNAVKFTPDGGVVTVELALADWRVELRVQDSGRGISDAHLEQVFAPFWQADTTHTRAHGGLGLGLSIVRHLVEAHGGTVTADSAGIGRGASFVVQFPLHRT